MVTARGGGEKDLPRKKVWGRRTEWRKSLRGGNAHGEFFLGRAKTVFSVRNAMWNALCLSGILKKGTEFARPISARVPMFFIGFLI